MSAHSMVDHVSLGTKRFDDPVAFYRACFQALGYSLEHQTDNEAAFGRGGLWDFWLYPVALDQSVVGARSHVAISAGSREMVARFFEMAVRQAASVVRSPGPRPDISPHYFGAVIKDLDGHTVEVVYWEKTK